MRLRRFLQQGGISCYPYLPDLHDWIIAINGCCTALFKIVDQAKFNPVCARQITIIEQSRFGYAVQSSGASAVFIPEKTQKSRRLNSVTTMASGAR